MKRYKIIFNFIAVFLITVMTSFKHNTQFADDFLEFWTDVKDNYAYFGKKHTDWNKVKMVIYRKQKMPKIKMS